MAGSLRHADLVQRNEGFYRFKAIQRYKFSCMLTNLIKQVKRNCKKVKITNLLLNKIMSDKHIK